MCLANFFRDLVSYERSKFFLVDFNSGHGVFILPIQFNRDFSRPQSSIILQLLAIHSYLVMANLQIYSLLLPIQYYYERNRNRR